MIILIAFFNENDDQRWVSFDDIHDFLCMVDNNIAFNPKMECDYEVEVVVIGGEVITSLPTVQDVVDYARTLMEARCNE